MRVEVRGIKSERQVSCLPGYLFPLLGIKERKKERSQDTCLFTKHIFKHVKSDTVYRHIHNPR